MGGVIFADNLQIRHTRGRELSRPGLTALANEYANTLDVNERQRSHPFECLDYRDLEYSAAGGKITLGCPLGRHRECFRRALSGD